MDEIKKHVDYEELTQLKNREKSLKALARINFIIFLYEGNSIKKTRRINGIHQSTAYSWAKLWNEEGVD